MTPRKAEAVKSGQGDPACSKHGIMHDPKGNGHWVCLAARCQVSAKYDSEDPNQ